MKPLLLLLLICLPVVLHAQLTEDPLNTRFYYSGVIEEHDHIQMNLHIDNHKVTGSFVMESTGRQFFIEGRLAKDKSGMGIRVYDSYQQYIASIEASVVSEDNNFGKKLIGVYKPAKEGIKKLILDKIAEFANQKCFHSTPIVALFEL